MIRALLATILALLLLAGPASADVSFADVEREYMCVSCKVPLDIADSPQSEQQREQLRVLVDEGLSRGQIRGRMVAIYGKNVLAEPDAEGFALLAWIVPIGAVAGLAVLGLLLLPRWRARRRSTAATELRTEEPELDPVEVDRVEADMTRLDT